MKEEEKKCNDCYNKLTSDCCRNIACFQRYHAILATTGATFATGLSQP